VVRPLLAEGFPRLRYAAGLLGPGSEVAGFDSQRSADHDWGPRLQVFLTDSDAAHYAAPLTAMLTSRLPATFRGFPVAFPDLRIGGLPLTGAIDQFIDSTDAVDQLGFLRACAAAAIC
jgi:hypothetical protein